MIQPLNSLFHAHQVPDKSKLKVNVIVDKAVESDVNDDDDEIDDDDDENEDEDATGARRERRRRRLAAITLMMPLVLRLLGLF